MTVQMTGLVNPHRRTAAHRVADIHFQQGAPSDEAPVSCSCGWKGSVADWNEHRGRPAVSRASTELERFERAPRWSPEHHERLSTSNANARKTRCPRGHAYTAENTRLEPTATGVRRLCRECIRIRARTRYYARAAA